MPPTAPAAPVTRIGLSCLCFVVMSLTSGYVQKRNWWPGLRRGFHFVRRPDLSAPAIRPAA